MTDPVVAQNSPYKVDVKEGENYGYRACRLSKNQPFFDVAHKQTDDFTPLVFVVEGDETGLLCGRKQTGNGSACDGTHKSL